MDISIFAGVIVAAGLVGFALIYSRSNANSRSRKENNDGTTSSSDSDTSSTYDSSSSKMPIVRTVLRHVMVAEMAVAVAVVETS